MRVLLVAILRFLRLNQRMHICEEVRFLHPEALFVAPVACPLVTSFGMWQSHSLL